jgi:hypothetical protein
MKRIFLTLVLVLTTAAAALGQDSPQTARKVVIGVTNAGVTGTTIRRPHPGRSAGYRAHRRKQFHDYDRSGPDYESDVSQ